MKIKVNVSKNTLSIARKTYACAIGKNGFIEMEQGREGDGKTPLGEYAIRYGFYRSDRVDLPDTNIVFHALSETDGWCDAPDDPAYNRPVKLPYPRSAENLCRESRVYDIIVVLGHNDNPPVPDLGSAIFLHVAREGYKPTEGCVAVSLENMLALLPEITPKSRIEIST